MITKQQLDSVLSYDHASGEFRSKKTGLLVGRLRMDGYLDCKSFGKMYLMHRLAWLHFHGVMPTGEIDHINRVRNDNRISNLRDVTKGVNINNQIQNKNRTGCMTGVSLAPLKEKPFRARITRDGVRIQLGYFSTHEEAAAEYRAAKQMIYGIQND